ncbi:MAG TPA: hypothetical protein VHU89_01955 [Acidobacteriaceae bacterium]|nr:hypothetical protein [Acidobacteriaceae bacterium]
MIDFEDIAEVMSKVLTAINIDEVKKAMRWLGGEPKIEMATALPALQPQLTDSREFGAVLRALAHMYATVDGRGRGGRKAW